MDDKIKIRAGAGLQSVLQSTVNFAQAFTELAKNSLQNGATKCDIDIVENEDTAIITIADDGRGFDHTKDAETQMNDFEKYFTFGNSYDLNADGTGPKLGRMGIGGKISNDKLSEANAVHWKIHTRNKHGQSFVIDYSPPANIEFFDDYSPVITEVPTLLSKVKSNTGTTVEILNVNKRFLKTDYKNSVKNELLEFFAHLVISYKKTGQMLDIVFLGEQLEFSIDLDGDYRGKISRVFKYEMNGETKHSTFEIALNQFIGKRLRRQRRSSFIKSVELVSQVKVCDLHITNKNIIENILARLSEEEGTEIDDASFLGLMGNFIGFVNCEALSTVLDERGMPAKDLSHHGLRNDHPMTTPFLEEVYYVIMKLTYHISQLSVRKSTRKTMNKNLIAYNVAKLLASDFSNDMEILTDKKMLGLNKVEKIDSAAKRDDLVLEKLIGDSRIPSEDDTPRHTIKLDGESSDVEEDSTEHSVATRDNKESEADPHDGVVPVGQSQYPWKGNPYADDDKQSDEKSKPSFVSSVLDSVKQVFGGTPKNKKDALTDSSEQKDEYTRMNVVGYRKLLKKRSQLMQQIEELETAIADGDDSPETRRKLEKLKLELKGVITTLSGLKLFYAIDYMDDPMVISDIREYRDGFIMIINENNIRYRSIQSDVMTLALHVAEAMIKEIIYIEDKKIDKNRLDSELSKFYERHYETLKGGNLLSM